MRYKLDMFMMAQLNFASLLFFITSSPGENSLAFLADLPGIFATRSSHDNLGFLSTLCFWK